MMDNKSELSNNARKAVNSFYNWSQLASCTSERVSCLTVEQLKETSELLSALLAELEFEKQNNAGVAGMVEDYETKLEAKDKRIAELEAIKAAAEKLVRCKGRYHSEQNYRALAALFGVTTPDLQPVDGDSEAVIAELRAKLSEMTTFRDNAVKKNKQRWGELLELRAKLATPVRLPDALIPAVHASGEPFMRPEPFGFYLNRDDVIKKLRAVGLTVEGDE